FFFFQAEDGIRDGHVTGVQTCALPIFIVEMLRDQNRSFGADSSTERNLERLAAGAVAIVTGQQVGLFTGPSYTIYKAVSALRVRSEERRVGKECRCGWGGE